MTFERTFDFDLARAIITHDSIYPHLTDNEDPSGFTLPTGGSNWYVIVRDSGALLGLFWLVPYNAVCWEAHTCFLPGVGGARAIRAYREGLAWIWRNSDCKKIVGNIPDYNRAALAVALRGGATVIGRNTKSLWRGGRLVDQIIVGAGPEKGK